MLNKKWLAGALLGAFLGVTAITGGSQAQASALTEMQPTKSEVATLASWNDHDKKDHDKWEKDRKKQIEKDRKDHDKWQKDHKKHIEKDRKNHGKHDRWDRHDRRDHDKHDRDRHKHNKHDRKPSPPRR